MRNLREEIDLPILPDEQAGRWTSAIYAFFEPHPNFEYAAGQRTHVFTCAKPGCKRCVRRYLDKGDASSTSNLRKHAVACWGLKIYESVKGSDLKSS